MNESRVGTALTFLTSLTVMALGFLVLVIGAGLIAHGEVGGWAIVVAGAAGLGLALKLCNRLPRKQP